LTVEHIHLDADGNTRNVEVHGYPLFDAEGQVVQVIEYALDITERRQAEEALERSEERYALAQRAADVGSWDWDIRSGALYWSDPTEAIFGLAPGEFGGTYDSFLQMVHAKDRQVVIDAVNASIQQGADYEIEHRIVWPDGTVRWVSDIGDTVWDEYGKAIRMLGVVQDITERKEAEQALREAKEAAETSRHEEKLRRREAERRRQIAESLAAILAALNSDQSLEGVLQFIAGQARRLLESPAVAIFRLRSKDSTLALQAASGLPSGCLDGTIPPVGMESLARAIATGKSLIEANRFRTRSENTDLALDSGTRENSESQTQRFQALLAAPIAVRGQVYGGIVVYDEELRVFSDDDLELAIVFGDQVALAIEGARAREHLREAAAAAERSRLARDLHDSVTQALFSASLVAEVLPQVWKRDPDEAQQGLQELRHLTRSALAEMRTMLLELRPQALLETTLSDLLSQLTEAITSRAELVVSCEIEAIPILPPDVHVTFYRVSQEALHNVVKYAEASQVTVSLRASPPLEARRASEWQGQVILYISDNGSGFDPENTAPGQLGLAIMSERAEEAGAMLSIKSGPGRGTQITLVWRSD
jgi:two-component system nitrate/nitrite sensor histidine kinase NarX